MPQPTLRTEPLTLIPLETPVPGVEGDEVEYSLVHEAWLGS